MRRLGIRIANAILFALCCYAVAGLFNEVSHVLVAPLEGPAGIALASTPKLTARSATRIRDINSAMSSARPKRRSGW